MPSPNESVAERILATINTAVVAVAAGSIYHHTYTVRRPAIHNTDFTPKNLSVEISLISLERLPEGDSGTNPIAQLWEMEVGCDGYVKTAERAIAGAGVLTVLPADKRVLRVWMDLVTVLNSNHSWGALALTTETQAPSFFTRNDGTFEGVRVVATVKFRTDENDPSQAR